jgi:hypothetical protein
MLKQLIAVIGLSIVIIFGVSYAHQFIQLLVSTHDWVMQLLTDVFSVGQAGKIARNLIALLTIPILASLLLALVYWFIRRRWLPYFMEIVWIVWLVQASALIMLYKVT